ncbi:MAG: hypothetical protein ACTS9Y_01490 [Methylophilus sp.]|uniref:hypothetical protein n=1 Tax=Methylophilus sp. TaxID=29541 RepID=UPI003F9EF0E4
MYKVVATVLFVALSGCASTIPPAQLAKPDHLTPIKSSSESKIVFIANVTSKLTDKKIGLMEAGVTCYSYGDLMWLDNQGTLNSIRDQMTNTLSEHGYKVYTSLIQASAERDADILIGVAIEDIKANICSSAALGYKGAASLRLTWEVLDNKTRKSLLLSAYGAAEIKEFNKTGDPEVFVKAAEMATENILAQPAFFEATRK